LAVLTLSINKNRSHAHRGVKRQKGVNKMTNNATVELRTGESKETKKPYTMLIVSVNGQEIIRQFPKQLELVGIKTLLNIK
jgi:hypothetical protein